MPCFLWPLIYFLHTNVCLSQNDLTLARSVNPAARRYAYIMSAWQRGDIKIMTSSLSAVSCHAHYRVQHWRDVHPMLDQCWATVWDAGQTTKQVWDKFCVCSESNRLIKHCFNAGAAFYIGFRGIIVITIIREMRHIHPILVKCWSSGLWIRIRYQTDLSDLLLSIFIFSTTALFDVFMLQNPYQRDKFHWCYTGQSHLTA